MIHEEIARLKHLSQTYSKEESVYLAALIDAKGVFTVENHCGKYGLRTKFTTEIRVATSNKTLVEYLEKVSGSNCSLKNEYPSQRRPHYVWRIAGKNLDILLEHIKPYIFLKRKEVAIMCKIRKTFLGRKRLEPISKDLVDLRIKYVKEFLELRKQRVSAEVF